jgi:hypothetical protein
LFKIWIKSKSKKGYQPMLVDQQPNELRIIAIFHCKINFYQLILSNPFNCTPSFENFII